MRKLILSIGASALAIAAPAIAAKPVTKPVAAASLKTQASASTTKTKHAAALKTTASASTRVTKHKKS